MIKKPEFNVLISGDFYSFLEWAFCVLNGSEPFLDNWHIQALAYHLMMAYDGDARRLLITLPPRYLKSHCASVAFPAWVLGRHPDYKFICASYGQKPAEVLAADTRSLMKHPNYLAAFPQTRLQNDSLSMLKTTRNGYRMATSVGGAATGFGCNCLIVDDMTKADASATERATAVNYYKSTLLSRLNNKAKGVAIVVGQRTALDDLPGHLLDSGGYRHLNLPAIAQGAERVLIGPNKYKHRSRGDLLHKEREDAATLQGIRRDIGEENFSAQYLQNPKAHIDAVVEPSWFPRYEKLRPLEAYRFRVLSIDTAFSAASTADYSACSVFGGDDEHYKLLYVWRKRASAELLFQSVDALIKKYVPTHIVVERSGIGISILDRLVSRYEGGVRGYLVRNSKEERLAKILNLLKDGYIHLPGQASWLVDFENEIFSFPNCAHDDQMDTLIQFLLFAARGFHRIEEIRPRRPGNVPSQTRIVGLIS